MPKLRSCYFCGAVGDSLQEYDVLPERLVSAEQSPSVVLCSTCREKLRRVLEPLSDAPASDPSTASALGYSSQEVTFESPGRTDGEESGDDGTSDDPEAPSDADTDGVADDGTSDEEASDDVNANAGSNGRRSSGTDESDVPDGYYKVLRLLQNREFPMERTDLTALVTGAYDVSEPQCERILETAVERGVLVEDGSTVDIGRS